MRVVLGLLAIVALVAGLVAGWVSFAMASMDHATAVLYGFTFRWPLAPIQAVLLLVLAVALAWVALVGGAGRTTGDTGKTH